MQKCARKVALPGRVWCGRPGLLSTASKDGMVDRTFVMCAGCRDHYRDQKWTVVAVGMPALKAR